MKKLFIVLMFSCVCLFAGNIYDSVVITGINDVNQCYPQPPMEKCIIVVYTAKAIKNGAVENKLISGNVSSANVTLNLGDYLKIGQLSFSKKALEDSIDMWNALCN